MAINKEYVETLVVIIGKNTSEYQSLINLLNENEYNGIFFKTIKALKNYLSKQGCMAVLIDIDMVPVENKEIRELTITYPKYPFLCMSSDTYHPELKDAICYHIYACINKPIDSDELFYLLRCIRDDNQ